MEGTLRGSRISICIPYALAAADPVVGSQLNPLEHAPFAMRQICPLGQVPHALLAPPQHPGKQTLVGTGHRTASETSSLNLIALGVPSLPKHAHSWPAAPGLPGSQVYASMSV